MDATGRLADHAPAHIADRDRALVIGDMAGAAPAALAGLAGRSVLVETTCQLAAAFAFLALDGLVRRMVIAPPDLSADHRAALVADAGVEAVVTDGAEVASRDAVRFDAAEAGRVAANRACDTEWVMLTSGTAGRPKLVAHTLAALCGAIGPVAGGGAVWSTFYDIRRYGGLQIFLRAVLGGAALVLSSPGEELADQLRRLGAAGVTALSGTPSHWRRVLMSPARSFVTPHYVRLSGETADQLVLDSLRAAFSEAAVGHAYASTEAGVAFAVDDGREGFPATLVDATASPIAMKVLDGTLRIRSPRTATRYIGPNAPSLHDADGFVDTGDLVERHGDRFLFKGRRGGIINVGGAKVNPEEVETVINGHPDVLMSRVWAKTNPVLGALVAADVVLREGAPADLADDLPAWCRERLPRHEAPALVRSVASLQLTPAGKLRRGPGDA